MKEKSRSALNIKKISDPAHLIFFWDLWCKSKKKFRWQTEKKIRCAGTEIFLRFDFSRPSFSEIKVQNKWLSVWIHCFSDLKNFANSRPSASNFKSCSRQLEFILTVGQNNFGKCYRSRICNVFNFLSVFLCDYFNFQNPFDWTSCISQLADIILSPNNFANAWHDFYCDENHGQ